MKKKRDRTGSIFLLAPSLLFRNPRRSHPRPLGPPRPPSATSRKSHKFSLSQIVLKAQAGMVRAVSLGAHNANTSFTRLVPPATVSRITSPLYSQFERVLSSHDCAPHLTEIYVGDIDLRRDDFTCRALLNNPTFAARRGKIKVSV
jgi:hypothetical protein